MGLFFDVLSSINNPNQHGSIDQLGTIINSIQGTAAERGISASQLQPVMSVLGSAIRPALQQQQNSLGGKLLENFIGQASGNSTTTSALQSLFPSQLQQQLVQEVAQKTGMNSVTIQGMLSTILPAVMGLLNMGASKSASLGANPILNAFLDGNTDLGHVLNFANRFLNPV